MILPFPGLLLPRSCTLGDAESLNAGTEDAAVAVGQSRIFDKEDLSSKRLF